MGAVGTITEYSRNGLTFDVTDRGDSADPAVVLLHGFPENRQSWDPISERLVAGGLRTLAPDQRGYSPRARPTEPYPQAYALRELERWPAFDRRIGETFARMHIRAPSGRS